MNNTQRSGTASKSRLSYHRVYMQRQRCHRREGDDVHKENGIYEFVAEHSSSVKIIVYDFTGKEITGSEFYKNKTVDLSFLPAGIYLLNVQSGDRTISRKIIIE